MIFNYPNVIIPIQRYCQQNDYGIHNIYLIL